MLIKILFAAGLVVVTVFFHAVGFDVLLRVMVRSDALAKFGFRPVTRWVIGLTCWLMLIHLAEIFVWGLFYFRQDCFPDAESAFYFSGVTYTSLGYGDLMLPKPWRMLAPVETLTGILMCGLSAGLFFAVVMRWISNWMQRKTALEPHAAAAINIDKVSPSKTKL
ncbi:MAG TPA: ion channel [Phycisphaerae bacterium]|nr:ion channel [Phycisphaerae bacterium]